MTEITAGLKRERERRGYKGEPSDGMPGVIAQRAGRPCHGPRAGVNQGGGSERLGEKPKVENMAMI